MSEQLVPTPPPPRTPEAMTPVPAPVATAPEAPAAPQSSDVVVPAPERTPADVAPTQTPQQVDGPADAPATTTPEEQVDAQNDETMLKVAENLLAGRPAREGLETTDGDAPATAADETLVTENDAPASLATVDPTAPAPDKAARLVVAKKALSNWNYPDVVIESMTDDLILETGEGAARRQAEVNTLANQKHEMSQIVENLLAERDQATPAPAVQPGVPAEAPVAPVGSKAAELFKVLEGDDIYDDIAGPIRAAFEELGGVKPVVAPVADQLPETPADSKLLEQIAARDAQIESMRTQADDTQLMLVRMRLENDYPGLKSQETFGTVKQKIYELSNLQGYHHATGEPDVEKLMTHACNMLKVSSAPVQKPSNGDATLLNYQQQTAGQPVDAHTTTTPPGDADLLNASKDDQMLHAIKALNAGQSVSQIQKAIGSG